MAFRGITFSGQNVTPKNDGALYNAHYGDGILEGCSMDISGDDLVIQSGHIIACGRVCQVDGATSVDLSGRTLQTGYIQIILNYDLTQGEGQQWYPTFVESATTSFPALTKEDINTPSGTLYQLQLAVVQISGGNLTALTTGLGLSSAVARRDGIPRLGMYAVESGGILYFYDAEGTTIGSLAKGSASISLNNYNAGSIQLFDSGPLYLNGDTINIRPHNDAVNQTIVNDDGTWDFGAQIKGGHPLLRMPKAGTTTIPGGTSYTALTPALTGLDANGLYVYDFKCGYTPSSSSTHTPRLRVGDQYQSFYCGAITLTYLGIQGIITGVTSLQPALTTMASSVSGSVQGGAELRVFRIN